MTAKPLQACNCWWLLALLLCGGCQTSERVSMQGTVTLDGKPLDEASIVFLPTHPDGNKTGAAIVKGHYTIDAEQGLRPGRFKVEIADNPPLDLVPAGSTAAQKATILAQRRKIPPQYSNHLTPLIYELTDGNSGVRTYDVPLSSK